MIYGIDEVGRGCLAGPVTAACVSFVTDQDLQNNSFDLSSSDILNDTSITERVCLENNTSIYSQFCDSKELSPQKRDVQAKIIRQRYFWGIGWAYSQEIDTLNIHHATLLAMKRAFDAVPKPKNRIYVLVDGSFAPPIDDSDNKIIIEPKVKGDTYIPQIQAASIVAKTSRDAYMVLLHNDKPEYGFDSHKGYPTAQHKQAIRRHGVQYFHRKSFKLK